MLRNHSVLAFVAAAAAQSACPVSSLTASVPAPSVAPGFEARLIATNLTKPRGIQFDQNGRLLVVEQNSGVVALTFDDLGGSCLAEKTRSAVINDTSTLYVSSSQAVFSFPYDESTGQVTGANQTLVDGMEGTDESLEKGLRNEVGIDEEPCDGGLYSVENSADEVTRNGEDIHENNPAEKMNFLGWLNPPAGTAQSSNQASNFGYPQCFAAWEPSSIPSFSGEVGVQFAIGTLDNGNNSDTSCEQYTPPRLVFQAHMAPLDIKFNSQGSEAWITFHGSWDRTMPSGYKVGAVQFDRNGPLASSNSTTALVDVVANQDNSNCPDECFRPVAMAWDNQGRLYFSSDATGEIYVITRADSYPATSRYLHNAIACDRSPLWRMLFAQQFDGGILGLSSNQVRSQYQALKELLSNKSNTKFTTGVSSPEKASLVLLRNLIIDNAPRFSEPTKAKNLQALRQFCKVSDLMDNVLEPKNLHHKRRPLLTAVQILLSFVSFDLSTNPRTFSFPQSQVKVYATPYRKPIFLGQNRSQIDLMWVLHVINFFKHYFTTPHTALEDVYTDLTRAEHVQPWSHKLKSGVTPLSYGWKGIYAYLMQNEVDSLRDKDPPEDFEDRWCDSDDVFQSLKVQMIANDHDPAWPDCFERHLHARNHPSVSFMESVKDDRSNHCHYQCRDSGHLDSKNPQARPKTTRAQLKQNPKAVLDNGPENSDAAISLRLDQPAASRNKAPCLTPCTSTPSTSTSAKSQPHTHCFDAKTLHPFVATGSDEEPFFASGFVSSLPAQQGIPGWQRFTMMKYFAPEDLDDFVRDGALSVHE
ncbi:MAG: hypothetical protein Q9162_004745, partial [Coniocarpon cinnabarinum]